VAGQGLGRKLLGLKLKLFGGYELEDPQAIRRQLPYTFFVPSKGDLAAVTAGDRVALRFRALSAVAGQGAVTLPVDVTTGTGDQLVGVLAATSDSLSQLKVGQAVNFERRQIADFQKPGQPSWVEGAQARSEWVRHFCLVDEGVVDGRLAVHFLYREPPVPAEEGDPYPDTGWRIRGDFRGMAPGEANRRSKIFVSIGVVLNQDDSWVHLKDAPVGSGFKRNFETDEFESAGPDPDA
jgi:hypothetical protein